MQRLRDSARRWRERYFQRNVFQPGHRVRLLYGGTDYFPLLLDEIAAAKREIYLETYLFEADDIGLRVMQACCDAALRGVSVHLQLDGFGARHFPLAWRQQLAQAGAHLLFFRPELKRFSLNRARLRRLHRKLAVFDGRVAYVGGINILRDIEASQPALAPRYDYAIRLEGPAVARVHRAVQRMWRQTAMIQLEDHRIMRKRPQAMPVPEPAGASAVKFVIRDNLNHRHDIETEYRLAIRRAQREIIIANAYFLPGYRFRQELRAAAERGVNVVLLLQGQVDHFLLHWATRAYYRRFLDAGIEIYEYTAGFMHAKVAVVDGEWATVGSSNLDPFSLLLAREANLFVRDERMALELRDDLRRKLIGGARRIEQERVSQAGLALRGLVWICFALVRFLMGVTGYGGRRYLE
ncbi:putative cardiolipin synthase [Andreprevotia lacus DSM 23236]|jgi:cardiolipin synthase|uniref:Cardiolipin synthase B n=1 Tax=Andreprevotia lacus DSM 23236 TaxID=1121001 RepID=A0A1W1XDW3_9NEIS|nr:cardiolipin synthase ClsB [Andreprevotia lacus]SMC22083.1 putative cardiolipin synthase [Andreprevotia lacus DSM 23236]